MKKLLLFLFALACGVSLAQGFDYAGYGISDPVAFQAAMQQSNAMIAQMSAQMQQTASACEASLREMSKRMPRPTAQQQFAAMNALQDSQLLSLQMQNSSLDAEMSANAWRQRELDVIREQGERECARISGVSLEQYRRANDMGVRQLNGSWTSPQANDTYYGDRYGTTYRIDMRGNAYEVTSAGEYLVP